jgi:Serine dehydratase beta chain
MPCRAWRPDPTSLSMLSFPPLIFSVSGVSATSFPSHRRGTASQYHAVGPSSSHTVGPMRAGKIFINDLLELGLLEKVGLCLDVRQRDD